MIDTESKLTAFLAELAKAEWVALDTEADSLHAYPEKVCLIQISTAANDYLVDPLAPIDVDPLLEAVSAHELIMHGADYDLRLFRKHHEFVPKTIFDTMLAARLLGLRQFGLSHLVQAYLGVTLEKGAQKANWALRPLTERMEKYARNDTHYLKPVADRLRAALIEKGRLAWHQETCARLITDASQQIVIDEDSVWRVKGSHALGRPALAVLRELWRWREEEAISANRPPFFVLSHETLVSVAAAASSSRPFEGMLPRHLPERRRSGLKHAVERGLAVPPKLFPGIPRYTSRRPSEAERKRTLELQDKRDAQAHKLEIDPTLIASRSTLSQLAQDWDKYAPELMKWQRALLEA